MKIALFVLLVGLMFSTSSFASSYELNVEKIRCIECVQKIHDYFVKTYGPRVQNLKIDMQTSKVTFDSISFDSEEIDNVKIDLKKLGFKVTVAQSQPVKEPQSLMN